MCDSNNFVNKNSLFEKQKSEPTFIDGNMWFQDYRFHAHDKKKVM